MGEELGEPVRRNRLQDRVAPDEFVLFADSAKKGTDRQMVNQERENRTRRKTVCSRKSLARKLRDSEHDK